jgi:leader peptidase (prepilin peptidase)/N-methyltransferase
MGLGDAKLAWGIGWFLGLGGAVSAVIFSFWIAFIPSVFLLFWRSKRFTMKSEIPFAPFLIIGTFVAYTFGVNILSWTF